VVETLVPIIGKTMTIISAMRPHLGAPLHLGTISTMAKLGSYAVANSIKWLSLELNATTQSAYLFVRSKDCKQVLGSICYIEIVEALTSEESRIAIGWNCEDEIDLYSSKMDHFHIDYDLCHFVDIAYVGQAYPMRAGVKIYDFAFFINPIKIEQPKHRTN
jgi:hypothetical protein